MFRPSGTHQCNPKFPKFPLKLNELESVICNHVGIQNTTIPIYSLETRKIKKIYIKTLNNLYSHGISWLTYKYIFTASVNKLACFYCPLSIKLSRNTELICNTKLFYH